MVNFSFQTVVQTGSLIPLNGNLIIGDDSSDVEFTGAPIFILPTGTLEAFVITGFLVIDTLNSKINLGDSGSTIIFNGNLTVPSGIFSVNLISGSSWKFTSGGFEVFRMETSPRQVIFDFASTANPQFWIRNSSGSASSATQVTLWNTTSGTSSWHILDMCTDSGAVYQFRHRADGTFMPRLGIYFWNSSSNQNQIILGNNLAQSLRILDDIGTEFMTFKTSLTYGITFHQDILFTSALSIQFTTSLMIKSTVNYINMDATKITIYKPLELSEIQLSDNSASSLVISGDIDFVRFRTTNGSEAVEFLATTRLAEVVIASPVTSKTVPGTDTLLPSEIINGIILADVTGTLNLPSPANLIASIPGPTNGDSFPLICRNTGLVGFTLGLNGNSAVPALASIAAGTSMEYRVRYSDGVVTYYTV